MNKTQKIILIIVLIVLSILIRFQNNYQTDFDSYWLHAQAESIQIHKSALWVFHPASLFGYFPLSYPSGTQFFLATASELTGLSMNNTVFLTSMIVGLLVIGMTFALAKEIFSKWSRAYLVALIVSLSPIIINYSSFNAGGRIFIMPFYLLFIWSMIKFVKTKEWKYSIIMLISIIISFFIHRTAQLMIIFCLAGFAAWFYKQIPNLWKFIQEHKHYKKHIHPRYEKNKYYLLLDVGILFFLAAIAKIGDLISRDRFGINVQNKLVTPVQDFLKADTSNYIFISILILLIIFCLTYIILRYYKGINILRKPFDLFHHHYHSVFQSPERYFLLAIGLFATYLFIRQFFGQSFYSPSIYDFSSTELLSGTSPIIIFANMIINYTTTVSILFIFSFVGFIHLLMKKKRSFIHWFLIFAFIGFSGVLLDKRYIRMFIIPFWSIFMVLGWFKFINFVKKIIKKDTVINILHFIMIMLLLVGSYTSFARIQFLGEEKAFPEHEAYWETGQYLRNLGSDFSTITTEELSAGVIIFASSGVPGGSHNIYYFVDEDKLNLRKLSFNELKDKATNGQKIENIWYLQDWIFGGQYYIGRHTIYLFGRSFTDEINQIIINDYNEKYYIHDKNEDENTFYQSLLNVKNKIYANPHTNIHDIHRGRE